MEATTLLSQSETNPNEIIKSILQISDTNLVKLKQEYERLDYQLQYCDCFRLWDLAEIKYRLGLVCYLIGQITKERQFFNKAKDAFNFVLNIEYYRHSDCTNQILERLINACENP